MRSTFKVLFYTKNQAIKNGRVPVMGRITVNGTTASVSVSAMLVYIHQKNIAQVFILERYFFVSIYPAAIPCTYLAVFLATALPLCL